MKKEDIKELLKILRSINYNLSVIAKTDNQHTIDINDMLGIAVLKQIQNKNNTNNYDDDDWGCPFTTSGG